MRQRRLNFQQDQDLRWEDLPAGTQEKIERLMGLLIEQAWQKRREGKDESKDHA